MYHYQATLSSPSLASAQAQLCKSRNIINNDNLNYVYECTLLPSNTHFALHSVCPQLLGDILSGRFGRGIHLRNVRGGIYKKCP
jgi:uncharacterized protein YfaT (DUF1175 family)